MIITIEYGTILSLFDSLIVICAILAIEYGTILCLLGGLKPSFYRHLHDNYNKIWHFLIFIRGPKALAAPSACLASLHLEFPLWLLGPTHTNPDRPKSAKSAGTCLGLPRSSWPCADLVPNLVPTLCQVCKTNYGNGASGPGPLTPSIPLSPFLLAIHKLRDCDNINTICPLLLAGLGPGSITICVTIAMQNSTVSLLFAGLGPCCYRCSRDNYNTKYKLFTFIWGLRPCCYHHLKDNFNATYNLLTFVWRPTALLLSTFAR